ncbi:hypothetical protein SRHO_G00123440 [Serrasalmus rhombeus]
MQQDRKDDCSDSAKKNERRAEQSVLKAEDLTEPSFIIYQNSAKMRTSQGAAIQQGLRSGSIPNISEHCARNLSDSELAHALCMVHRPCCESLGAISGAEVSSPGESDRRPVTVGSVH